MKILDQHKFKLYFNLFGFGKNPENDIVDYDFKISFDHIETSFSKHYNQLMKSERSCFDFEDDYEDFYIALYKLNFPDLDEILNKNRRLFFLFVEEYLRTEFLDSVLHAYPFDRTKYGFLVNSLKKMTLLDDSIKIVGAGYLVKPSVFEKLSYERSLEVIESLL